jgi:Domain of unknown function (DUF4410)
MKTTSPACLTLLSGLAMLFASCASVSVKGVQNTDAAKPGAKPARIYVEPFAVARTSVKEHPMRKNPGALKTEARDLVAKYLVKELSRHVAPASLVAPGSRPGRGGWLVTGEFTRLNEGSRFMRMAVGLGMGGTKMETRVAVRNLPAKNRPFLTFSTTGGSGAGPGAATNPIPFSSAPTALLASKSGITDDAERTARMITAEIAQYAAERGWIPAASVPKTKRAREAAVSR